MSYKDMYIEACGRGEVERVTPTYFEFVNKEDSLVGEMVSFSIIRSGLNEGEYNQYIFNTDDGLVKFALGGATDREVAPLLSRGCVYHIVYLGQEELKGGKRVNKFDVTRILSAKQHLSNQAHVNVPF